MRIKEYRYVYIYVYIYMDIEVNSQVKTYTTKKNKYIKYIILYI